MAMRAFSYILYDDELGRDNSTNLLKIEGIRYIGQTINPQNRLDEHKTRRPHLNHCRMILIRQHQGPDAVLRSLADKFVLFTISELFPHLKSGTQAASINSHHLNTKARELASNIFYGLEVFFDLGQILMGEKTIEFPSYKCSSCHMEYRRSEQLRRHVMEKHTMPTNWKRE